MNTVAVVGSNGYIGRHVVADMRKRGIRVIAMSSQDGTGLDPRTGLFKPDFTFSEKIDAVIYAAQSPRYRDVPDAAWHLLAVNCAAPLQVATAATKAGAKNFIYLSTGNVYKPGFEPLKESDEVEGSHWYPFSKVQGEQALNFLQSGLRVTVVRVFAVYGPDQTEKLISNLIDSVEVGRQIVCAPRVMGSPDGGLRINPCYIDDAVDVLISLACSGGPQVLNLAGPQVINIRDIASLWGRLRGLKPVFSKAVAPRTMDLIADTSLLNAYVSRSLLRFDQGLANIAATWSKSPGA